MGVPLRDRDDLPDDVARVLAVRRHSGNPWTEEDALVVARFGGYTPLEPWPGSVGIVWRGVCELGHPCSAPFSHILNGRRPCGKQGHPPEAPEVSRVRKKPGSKERREANEKEVRRIAEERGDTILELSPVAIKAGKSGMVRVLSLTVRYACGHESGPLAIRAANYKRSNAGGCGRCNPSRVIPGVNTLDVLRPDLACELVDPSLASRVAPGGWTKVEWRCSDCGHVWKATLGNRAQLGSGCPKCNGAGYNEQAPGTLYVVQGASATTREILIKVGISNVPEQRLHIHAKQGLERLLSRFTWSDGTVAPTVERNWVLGIRKAMPDHLKARKVDLPDGYGEAVIDTDETRLAIHAFLLEAQVTRVETLTEKVFDPEVFLPRVT